MREKIETGRKSTETGKKPAPPDAIEAERAFKARVAAARARVNALLAGQGRPPLKDAPLPPVAAGTDEKSEMRALEFLQTAAHPEAYRDYAPSLALGLMAAGTRAGLKMVAEARGEPPPDFSAEKKDSSPAKPTPEEEEARDRAWDRGRWAYAEENGGLVPLTDERTPVGGWRQPRLPDPVPPPLPRSASPAAAPGADETEAQLNGLIADCRLLLREVAFHSARLACEAGDRVRFIEAGCRVAEAGAKIGKTVARLRGGTAIVAEHRQRMVVEHVHTERLSAAAVRGEGGA